MGLLAERKVCVELHGRASRMSVCARIVLREYGVRVCRAFHRACDSDIRGGERVKR